MKKILKPFIFVIALCILAAVSILPCAAANETGSMIVTLEDKDKNKISNTTIHLCQIAELNNTGYFPATAFENSGISIAGIINNPNQTAADSIAKYIKENNIPTLSETSADGKVAFHNLSLGIWLVFCEENGQYSFNPYIIFLPYESGGKLYYNIDSFPKLEINTNIINIYVVKKWDDKNNAAKKRPESITVDLLDGDTVISSAELNELNGWSHTFPLCNKNGNYAVRENAITDYKATYSGDATNGFIITNTYIGEKLPQTGQYWWPIALIAIAGLGFILLGIYEMRAKKHGKKEK